MDAHADPQRHGDANGQRYAVPAVAAVDPALRCGLSSLRTFHHALA
jgi:hypothetical protein